jgi:cysteinyl-tRNA synthetase
LGALFVAAKAGPTKPGDLSAFERALFALGLDLSASPIQISAPAEICALAERRWTAKKVKDYAAADALRKELAAAGWSMLDGKDGYKLEPVKK